MTVVFTSVSAVVSTISSVSSISSSVGSVVVGRVLAGASVGAGVGWILSEFSSPFLRASSRPAGSTLIDEKLMHWPESMSKLTKSITVFSSSSTPFTSYTMRTEKARPLVVYWKSTVTSEGVSITLESLYSALALAATLLYAPSASE